MQGLASAIESMGKLMGYMEIKSMPSYRLNLRAAARSLWLGITDGDDFLAEMVFIIQRGLTLAWIAGSKLNGITFEEMTTAERVRLRREIDSEIGFSVNLADYIEANSKANGGKYSSIISRLEKWVTGYTRVKNIATIMTGADKKKKWTLHPAEHYSSCRKLDGKIKRSSFWASHNVFPKAWDKLECRLGCKCTLEDTTEPLTRGPLPNLP